eukprot:gene5318-6623_t
MIGGSLIAAFVIGTPIFFIVNYFVTHFEEKRKEELELQEMERKIAAKTNPVLYQHHQNSSGNGTVNSNTMSNQVNIGSGCHTPERRYSGDLYGTAKILKEVIERHPTINQIYTTSSPPTSPSTSSPKIQRSNSNASFGNVSIPENNGMTKDPNQMTKSVSFQSTVSSVQSQQQQKNPLNSSSNNQSFIIQINKEEANNNRNSMTIPIISAPIDPTDSINKLLTPPSPVLSTFGKTSSKESSKPHSTNTSPIFSPNFFQTFKRTLSTDKPISVSVGIESTPTPSRPKSVSLSQNLSLLTYLSSNTIPKDHWNCIVHRILELLVSFWSPPKFDGHASLTALNQIELALAGFSEQEQNQKFIKTIEDQKYFSPIIFDLYEKILPLHEFIRKRNAKIEKDIHGVYGAFTIILPSLLNSFDKWYTDLYELEDTQRKKNLQSSNENILDLISDLDSIGDHDNNFKEKKQIHKHTFYYLIDYIRNLLFFSIRKYNGLGLYKIIDKYHGIADDLDRLLYLSSTGYQSEKSEESDFELKCNLIDECSQITSSLSSSNNSISESIPVDIDQQQQPHIPTIITTTNSQQPTSININNIISPPLSNCQSICTSCYKNEATSECICNSVNNLNLLEQKNYTECIKNQFQQIDQYLNISFSIKQQQQQQQDGANCISSTSGTSITIQQQKLILSFCHEHIQTGLNIFSSSEYFLAKLKIDAIPVIKMLIHTLQNLEDHLETGISLDIMPSGELLEWMSNYAKITTTLNNLILKHSSSIVQQTTTTVSNSNEHQLPVEVATVINMNDLTSSTTATSHQILVPPPIPPLPQSHLLQVQQLQQQSQQPSSQQSPRKYKPPSSPFGSPTLNSYLSHSHTNTPCFSSCSLSTPDNNNGKKATRNNSILIPPLPSSRERCLQVIQLSQDSIMIGILACLTHSHQDLKSTLNRHLSKSNNTNNDPSSSTSNNNNNNEDKDAISSYFKDNVGVFFSALRTNIFCTFLLLNPIYDLHQ